MRWRLVACSVLGSVAACGSGGGGNDGLMDGSLVGLREGEIVVRTLTAPLGSSPDVPEWATIDGSGRLVLAPPCGVVTGFDGPPALFTFDLDNGTNPILVQVTPSIEGTCRPRVRLCIEDAGHAVACLPPEQHLANYHDDTLGDRNLSIQVDQWGRSDALDQHIYAWLDQRGDPQPLTMRVASDGPLRFTSTADSVLRSPLNPGVLGEFGLSYDLASGNSILSTVASGSYRLKWNDNAMTDPVIRIELYTCASTAGSCVPMFPTSCLTRPGNATTATVGFRVWYSRKRIPASMADLVVSARFTGVTMPLTVTSETQQTSCVPLGVADSKQVASFAVDLPNMIAGNTLKLAVTSDCPGTPMSTTLAQLDVVVGCQ